MSYKKNIWLFALLLYSCNEQIRFTEAEKKNPSLLLHKARNLYIADDYTRAEQAFRYILKHYSEDLYSASWAQYELGMIAYKRGDYNKSIQIFQELLQKYPLPPEPRILAQKLIKKINNKETHKRSTYQE